MQVQVLRIQNAQAGEDQQGQGSFLWRCQIRGRRGHKVLCIDCRPYGWKYDGTVTPFPDCAVAAWAFREPYRGSETWMVLAGFSSSLPGGIRTRHALAPAQYRPRLRVCRHAPLAYLAEDIGLRKSGSAEPHRPRHVSEALQRRFHLCP